MEIIENKIQYYWVRNRIAKLQKLIDENTPANSPYRIELELLSKLEKKYSNEYSSVLEEEIEAVITNNVEKKKINIYEGLPVILEKVKGVALEKTTGRTDAWLTMRLRHNMMGGKPLSFKEEDLVLVNRGLEKLGEQIGASLVQFSSDRDAVIAGIRNANLYIAMPYIYEKVWKKDRQWYANRMRERKSGGKASSFKEEDILKMNVAIMQIANELKSIEFVL